VTLHVVHQSITDLVSSQDLSCLTLHAQTCMEGWMRVGLWMRLLLNLVVQLCMNTVKSYLISYWCHHTQQCNVISLGIYSCVLSYSYYSCSYWILMI